MLKFEGRWRFSPPADGQWYNQTIPNAAVEEFFQLVMKVTTQGDAWAILEHFKAYFCPVAGTSYTGSSSMSWAESDLHTSMRRAAENAPLFLEAFHDACDSLRQRDEQYYVPDSAMLNTVCAKHQIGYEIQPPHLILLETQPGLIAVPQQPPTLAETAVTLFQESLSRAGELLQEGRGREAVQETLWLLESVTTAFKGIEAGTNKIQGKYFNQIIGELRQWSQGTTLERVLDWITSLHGYLSSPTGGGIRHGLDLNDGTAISQNEARLFCNLVRSYLAFLLAEHERLVKD
jgi:hypothetical protein